MAQSKPAAQQLHKQHGAYLDNAVINPGKTVTAVLKSTSSNLINTHHPHNDAANDEFGTTVEAAHIVRKKPQTLRKANSQHGHFMGVTPNKDPETRTLYWNLTLLRAKVSGHPLLNGQTIQAANNDYMDGRQFTAETEPSDQVGKERSHG